MGKKAKIKATSINILNRQFEWKFLFGGLSIMLAFNEENQMCLDICLDMSSLRHEFWNNQSKLPESNSF